MAAMGIDDDDDKNKDKKMKMTGATVGGEGTAVTSVGKIPRVDIYFVVGDNVGDGERWYAINKSSYSSFASSPAFCFLLPGYTSLDPALPPRPGPINALAFASIGSRIYSSDGIDNPHDLLYPHGHPSNKVFYIDTLRPQGDGWKEASPTIIGKAFAYLFADNVKIYAFGGLNLMIPPDDVGKRLFVEFYDPKSNAWYEMARVVEGDDEDPDFLSVTVDGHAVVDHGNYHRKILFHDY